MTDAEPRITIGETADGAPFSLPIAPDDDVGVLTGRGAIFGKTGSGKSNTASVVAEELLERGFAIMIVDLEGEYYGLKEEYQLLHVGATDECDLQVGPEHAEKLAELGLEQNVPVILDLSGYVDADAADELLRETARHLFDKEQTLKKPFLLFVEEIHEYLPEGGGLDDTGQMLVRIGKRGRKRGLGLVGISQRPANVRKDFITQCDWLVWHRLTWDNDRTVVRKVVDKATAEAVADLADGEAFIQADWTEADLSRVQARRKHTFDAAATPGLGDVERPELKSIDEDLVDELDEISQQAERRRDRVAELEDRLEEKADRISELERELEQARDVQNAAQQLATALQEGAGGVGDAEIPTDFEEQLEEKNETIASLEEQLADVQEERDGLQERVDDLAGEVERLESYRERVDEAERIEARAERAQAILAGDVPLDESADQAIRQELHETRQENDRLREQLESAGDAGAGDDSLTGLLHHEAVQTAVDTAKENTDRAGKHFDSVLSVLATADDALSASDAATPLSVSDSTVHQVLKGLHAAGVVQTEGSNPTKYKLDREFIEQRIKVAEKQAEIAAGGGGR